MIDIAVTDRIHAIAALDKAAPGFVADFEAGLTDLVPVDDPSVVTALLPLFDDASPHDEAMFALIHMIERFDDRAYIGALLQGMKDLVARSPRWASIVVMRALNAPGAVAALCEMAPASAAPDKDALRWLLTAIGARGAPLAAKTEPVLAVL